MRQWDNLGPRCTNIRRDPIQTFDLHTMARLLVEHLFSLIKLGLYNIT